MGSTVVPVTSSALSAVPPERSRLKHLGIPANFQSIVINAVETGTVPCSGQAAPGSAPADEAQLVQQVIRPAYSAFYTGLRAALFMSAARVLAAGLFAVTLVSRRRPSLADRHPRPAWSWN